MFKTESSKKTNIIYSDRFIPIRYKNNWDVKFNLPENFKDVQVNPNSPKKTQENKFLFHCLLKNEILGTDYYDLNYKIENCKIQSNSYSPKLFSYARTAKPPMLRHSFLFSAESQKLLKHQSVIHQLSPIPIRILDAPNLDDDFYKNLIDWSSKDIISVCLGSSVYLWSCATLTNSLLFDIETDYLSSIAWHENGDHLVTATDSGVISMWDVEKKVELKKLKGQSDKVNVLHWNGNMLSSGGSDTVIIHHDVRVSNKWPVMKYKGHAEEICGLKWSPNKQYLASGASDTLVMIWDKRSSKPLLKFREHTGAIKALAWCPLQQGILLSGGGAQDRNIKIWNINSGKKLQTIKTGSQVCNLVWSRFNKDFLSTHGVPNNEIHLWNYTRLTRIGSLPEQISRVLYLAVSPDGTTVATAGGEELKIWDVFESKKKHIVKRSVLNLSSNIR